MVVSHSIFLSFFTIFVIVYGMCHFSPELMYSPYKFKIHV